MSDEQKIAKNKKPIYNKIWFWVLLIIVVIAVGSAIAPKDSGTKVSNTNDTNSSSEEKTDFKIGDTIAFDDKKVIVQSAERNWNTGNEYIKPDTGKEYVKVEVSIENDSSNEVSYNTFDWKIQDSNGTITDIDSNTFTIDGSLGSGDLATGGKVSGFIVFEVPSGDTNLTLRYEPSFWSDKKLEIKLQ